MNLTRDDRPPDQSRFKFTWRFMISPAESLNNLISPPC